jgi:hypothetical protein
MKETVCWPNACMFLKAFMNLSVVIIQLKLELAISVVLRKRKVAQFSNSGRIIAYTISSISDRAEEITCRWNNRTRRRGCKT